VTTTLDDVAREAPDPDRAKSRPAPRLTVTVPDLAHVQPGTGATLQVVVQNLGDDADHVELSFDGPDWAWLAPRRVSIGPGATARVRLSVAPPRRQATTPSRWPYAVLAGSLRHPDTQAIAESALLMTSSPASIAVSIHPQVVAARGPASYLLSITNGGAEALAAVELVADGHLRQEAPASATVPGGEMVNLELTVTPRRGRFIRPRDHDFAVVVQVGADTPARLTATYRQLPRIPARVNVLLALLATVAVLSAGPAEITDGGEVDRLGRIGE
jgi:hypothetical protein